MDKAFHKLSDAIGKLKLAVRESDSDHMGKRTFETSLSSSDDSRASSSHSVASDYSLRSLTKRRRSFCDNDLRRGSSTEGNLRPRRHSFTVQISDPCRKKSHSNLGCHGEALSVNSCDRIHRKPTFKEVHISCPMGDMYSPAHQAQSQRGKLEINDKEKLSSIIDGLEFNGYTATKLLHKGHFSHVLLAYTNYKHSSKYIAVKVLDEATSGLEESQNSEGDLSAWLNVRLPTEVMMLQTLHHMNIVRMLEHITLHRRTMLFLEFCDAGNLENLIRNHRSKGFLVEAVAKRYFYQILAGLTFLHNQSIVHRDLRPANILVDPNNQLKICDFRTARKVRPGEMLKSDDMALSPYHAPEVFRGAHDPRTADIWALGTILYAMLLGQPPYGDNVDVVEQCSFDCQVIEFNKPDLIIISPDAHQILLGLLHLNADSRFSLKRLSCLNWNCSPCKSVKLKDQQDVFIGNFHLSYGPHKLKPSSAETQMKNEFGI